MKVNKNKYTHYARFMGVDCYWNDDTSELVGRGRVSQFLLDTWGNWAAGMVEFICSVLNPVYEPMWRIVLLGEIKKEEK